jgi:hypothetical protein
MGRLGFEPKTNRLKAECSTAELATHCAFRTQFINVTSIFQKSKKFNDGVLLAFAIALLT